MFFIRVAQQLPCMMTFGKGTDLLTYENKLCYHVSTPSTWLGPADDLYELLQLKDETSGNGENKFMSSYPCLKTDPKYKKKFKNHFMV